MSMVAWLAGGQVEETGSRRFSANVPLRRGVGDRRDAHARKILVTAVISQTVPATPTDRGGIGNDGWIRNRAAGPQQPVGA